MATLREEREQLEHQIIGPYGVLAENSKGRLTPEEECPVRTCFQRDVDRITHSKAFRRLKHKTQVFLQPEGDHYRTRLTHTLEVTRLARTAARALRLNEDLTEAIALGHDLGHTPYGHIGERTLDDLMEGGFRHNEHSLRVIELLENDGQGLNLTREVRDGILTHSGSKLPLTLEADCVRRADRIAYLNHDLDDAMRAGVLKPFELPVDVLKVLGQTHGERINTMITDIVTCSMDAPALSMSPAIQTAMDALRDFMFERVYRDGWRDPEEARCDHVIRSLFRYYCEHPAEMPEEFVVICYRDGTERGVCDFLSCMSDRYATRQFQKLFVPSAFPAF